MIFQTRKELLFIFSFLFSPLPHPPKKKHTQQKTNINQDYLLQYFEFSNFKNPLFFLFFS